MKKFLNYISKLLIGTVFLMVVLDCCYTYVYNTGSYRNKVMWIRDMKPVSLDYAIFGNSRANYSVNPDIILSETKKEGLNLGVNASGPFEVYLTVQEFLKKHHAKKIYVQVDFTYDQVSPDPVGQISWLPYMKEKEIADAFNVFCSHKGALIKFPFYRYLKYDARVGFRNMFLSLIKKPPNFLNNKGYLKREGILNKNEPYTYSVKSKKNFYIEKITNLCLSKNIEVVYFTAPIFNAKSNFSNIEYYLSNYYDMSDCIKAQKYFSDQTHLNTLGAAKFTDLFIQYFF